MSKSKLTLLIDGNWLLMSRLSIVALKYDNITDLCKGLKLLMCQSINIVTRTFPDIDNIIFCSDGGSWRNNLDIPSCLHHDILGKQVEYKGQREKDESVDWDAIFNMFYDFQLQLRANGINVCQEKGIEGDDWIWHWSTLLNSEGTNCIIWSCDKDLTQLVNIDKDECFTVWWNKKSGVYCSDYNDEDIEFLFNIKFSQNDNMFKHICEKASNVTKINPKNIVIDKIFKGDGSDNIFPLAERNSKNNSGKKFKINTKDIDFNIDINNIYEVQNYFEKLLESKSYKNRVICSLNEIMEHFIYNKTLVWLNASSYPEEILNIMNNYKSYNTSKDLSQIISEVNAEKNNLKNILDII